MHSWGRVPAVHFAQSGTGDTFGDGLILGQKCPKMSPSPNVSRPKTKHYHIYLNVEVLYEKCFKNSACNNWNDGRSRVCFRERDLFFLFCLQIRSGLLE